MVVTRGGVRRSRSFIRRRASRWLSGEVRFAGERIEGMLKKEPAINQVLLIGDRMPYVTALFTVNGSPGEAQETVQKAVKSVNKQLASFEQIRKFKILERDFSIEQGELTPTMKVRRNRVLENHRTLVSEMYMGKDVE